MTLPSAAGHSNPEFPLSNHSNSCNSSSGPKVLVIDSYDSFTFNLCQQVSRVLQNATVVTIYNNSLTFAELSPYLPLFDAIIIGPGPGNPTNPSDIGFISEIFSHKCPIPILGICLGFQSLCHSFGYDIHELVLPKHGIVYNVKWEPNAELFRGCPEEIPSVRYHSLYAAAPSSETTPQNPALPLQPLAYTYDADNGEHILMAAKHVSLPYYGVQYHPESICSEHGDTLMRNFFSLAAEWSAANGGVLRSGADEAEALECLSRLSRLYEVDPNPITPQPEFVADSVTDSVAGNLAAPSIDPLVELNYKTFRVGLDNATPDKLCELLGPHVVFLNSAAHPGRWSVVGVLIPEDSPVILHSRTYRPDHVLASVWTPDGSVHPRQRRWRAADVWEYVAAFLAPREAQLKSVAQQLDWPFVGGLVGYFGYEEGRFTLPPKQRGIQPTDDLFVPDTNLVYVERFALYDNKTGQVIIASVRRADDAWVSATASNAENALSSGTPGLEVRANSAADLSALPISYELPDKNAYIETIKKAQTYLQSGDSYELCVTAQTKIRTGRINAYEMYKILRKRNPAPYSCFLPLPLATVLGASPERFLSCGVDGRCELRPIKGTVRKGNGMTFAKASEILKTPKEIAENLMIVDLIRHDVNLVADEVSVPELMTVEEYETVYQLVSVIQGKLKNGYKGLDLLAYSLPPGSMTGAPKKRSVELLHGLESGLGGENGVRGVYSGVTGYFSLNGGCDWSVVIRSAFSYAAECTDDSMVWRIGAGGAITILSDPEAEWEEMITKLEAALLSFK